MNQDLGMWLSARMFAWLVHWVQSAELQKNSTKMDQRLLSTTWPKTIDGGK